MPKPRPQESEDDFMARCVPQLIHEGHERPQAIAECLSLYREHKNEEQDD